MAELRPNAKAECHPTPIPTAAATADHKNLRRLRSTHEPRTVFLFFTHLVMNEVIIFPCQHTNRQLLPKFLPA